jgi:hypothetical protein
VLLTHVLISTGPGGRQTRTGAGLHFQCQLILEASSRLILDAVAQIFPAQEYSFVTAPQPGGTPHERGETSNLIGSRVAVLAVAAFVLSGRDRAGPQTPVPAP